MSFKLSNAIGSPFRGFVTDQLQKRVQRTLGNPSANFNRSPEEVLYLANKMAWVRLVSSVNVQDDYVKELEKAYKESGISLKGNELARNWVLQAGTARLIDASILNGVLGLQGDPIKPGFDLTGLRSGIGLNGSYGLGGIQAQGYRPMPGLESVTIETAGRLGSLRFATINFKVWNMNQLDIIDALYFRLGFSMLVEWGHVNYFLNNNTWEQSTGGINGFFADGVTKEEVQYEINKKVVDTDGNYDGMLGVVTNFNYSFNQEGGWDCMIRIVGLGNIMETQRINNSFKLPPGLAKTLDAQKAKILREATREANRQRAIENLRQQVAAQGIYNDQKKAFDAQFPITDWTSLYNAMKQNSNKRITDDPALTTAAAKGSRDTLFVEYSILSPWKQLIASVDLPYDKQVGYEYNKNVYLPWTRGVGGASNGIKYPLKENNEYYLDSSNLDFVVSDAYKRTQEATFNSYFGWTKALYNVGTFAKQTSFKNVNEISTFNQMLVYAATENQWRREDNKTDKLRFTIEPIKQTITATYGEQRKEQAYNPVINPWKFNVAVELSLNISGDYYLSSTNVANALNTLLNQGASYWKLTSYNTEKITDFALDSNFSEAKLLNITLVSGGTLKNINTYLDRDLNKQGSIVDATITITIETNVSSIIAETKSVPGLLPEPTLGGGGGGVGGDTPPIKVDPSQIEKAGGLGSALEAMLTIIQFEGIDKADKNNNKIIYIEDIDDTTKAFLDVIENASLKDVFIGNQASSAPVPKPLEEPAKYLDPYNMGIKGYNSALMGRQVEKKQTMQDLYEKVPTVDFKKLMKAYILPKFTFEDSNISGDPTITAALETPVYISLGYLLYFINNLCLVYDSTKKGPNRPQFYVDFNPETNYCLTIPQQMSVDPTVCLIPFSGNDDDFAKIYKNIGIENPASYLKPSNNSTAIFTTNVDKISTEINNTAPFRSATVDSQGTYRAHTMNILLNVNYLLTALKDSSNTNDHSSVYFKSFIDRILADVNKSLGDINAFRLGYIDSSNTAVIFDDQYVPPAADEANNNLLMKVTDQGRAVIPVYGETSLVRSLRYETNISTKMSSMIAIGARGGVANATSLQGNRGSTQSTDASSLYWLNSGLEDRVIRQAEDSSRIKTTEEIAKETQAKEKAIKEKENTKLALAQKFNEQVRGIYGGTGIDKSQTQPSVNYLIQSLTIEKAENEKTSGATPIPLNIDFTIDGISGINMGNVFLIPEERVPITLRSKKLNNKYQLQWGYMVVGLTHNIRNNEWLTDIKGQIIKLRSGDTLKDGTPDATGTGTSSNTAAQTNTAPQSQQTQQQAQQSAITLPYKIDGSYRSTDIDAAHAVGGTRRVDNKDVATGKSMEEMVNEAQMLLYNNGINPKITRVYYDIDLRNGTYTTTWIVEFDRSSDGKAWTGFASKGSGGSGYAQRADDQIAGKVDRKINDKPNPCFNIQYDQCLRNVHKGETELITIYETATIEVKQYFYQFTKPTTNPPK